MNIIVVIIESVPVSDVVGVLQMTKEIRKEDAE